MRIVGNNPGSRSRIPVERAADGRLRILTGVRRNHRGETIANPVVEAAVRVSQSGYGYGGKIFHEFTEREHGDEFHAWAMSAGDLIRAICDCHLTVDGQGWICGLFTFSKRGESVSLVPYTGGVDGVRAGAAPADAPDLSDFVATLPRR